MYTESQVKKIIKIADNYYQNNDYNAALNEYEFLVRKFPGNAELAFRLGVCIIHEKYDKSEALPYFKYAASKSITEAIKMLGLTYHQLYRFDEAEDMYREYIAKSDTNSREFKKSNVYKLLENTRNAKKFYANPVKGVTIQNLGRNINSPYPDYVPVVNADDQEIFFTSRRPSSTGGRLDHNEEYFEDIFYSHRDSAGKWTAAKQLSDNLNSHHHDAVAGLSADAHTMIIYKNDLLHGAGDLYVSYLRGNDWTEPAIIESEVNLPESWEPSASLTANEDGIYFSSNRKGGFGGSDIYYAKRMPNGKWGKPTNLGSPVNTPYDEDAPFIHPDGKVLYFSSNGHENMGGYDIFKTIKNPDGTWQKPQNMGYPVNSADDDVFFVISADSKHGYFSSIRQDSYGEKDIYQVTFPDEEKPIAIIKGRVSSIDDKNLGAQIFVNKNGSAKLSGLFNSNISTGKYLLVLQPGNDYRIVFAASGFHNDTLFVKTKEIDSYNQIIKNIVLRPLSAVNPAGISSNDTTAYSKPNQKEIIVLHKKGWAQAPQKLESVIDTAGKIKYIPSPTFTKNNANETTATDSTVSSKKEFTKNEHLKSATPTESKNCIINSADSMLVFHFNFGYKMNTLNSSQLVVLDSILLKHRKKISFLKLNTHTDNIGSEKYNLILSEKRAKYLLDKISEKGINKNKIYTCYYGKSKPIAPNQWPDGKDNPHGRFLNRRAELQLILK